VAVSGAEGSLPLITFTDSGPIVGVSEVEFREHNKASKAMKQLTSQRSEYRFLIVMSLRPR
jgi:hypothetical protein